MKRAMPSVTVNIAKCCSLILCIALNAGINSPDRFER